MQFDSPLSLTDMAQQLITLKVIIQSEIHRYTT